MKVDKVQVKGGDDGTTFAVCLDQDEKTFIQSVTRYNGAQTVCLWFSSEGAKVQVALKHTGYIRVIVR